MLMSDFFRKRAEAIYQRAKLATRADERVALALEAMEFEARAVDAERGNTRPHIFYNPPPAASVPGPRDPANPRMMDPRSRDMLADMVAERRFQVEWTSELIARSKKQLSSIAALRCDVIKLIYSSQEVVEESQRLLIKLDQFLGGKIPA